MDYTAEHPLLKMANAITSDKCVGLMECFV
jgi:hypothetical protein